MLFEFKDISYTLGNEGTRRIVVSGAVKAGETLIVRGASGVGKSTLLRILARLQPGKEGEAFLQGKSWLHIPPPAWRVNIHYLAQQATIFDGTVADNLAMPFATKIAGQKLLDINRAKELMDKLHLGPELWHQDARTLSGGEASRLAFIRSLLIDPTVLLLDEPTAALDDEARQALYKVLADWLKGSDHAALLISHNNDYQQLDQITFLDIKPLERGV
ncbi:ABC transporter ATP-binding protein [Desulfotomaculum defluvii]